MFSWSNLFNLQNCELNNSMVNWLGVEKEGLSTECTNKLGSLKGSSNFQEKVQHNPNLNYTNAK